MKKKTKITQTGETISQEIETPQTTGDIISQEIETPQTTGETITKELTIFDKYRKYINMANSNYLHDLSYGDAMQMLRYIEKQVGHNISFSMSCPACVIDLVKMFGRLENK